MIELKKKKCVIVDTSVLLYDAQSIYNFGSNDIYLPFAVLEELDKKKTEPGAIGENARFINRLLDKLRKEGPLHMGVPFNDVKLTVLTNIKLCKELEEENNDNVILSAALHVQDTYEDQIRYDRVKLITKDINLRVKSDVLGILSADYYANYEGIDTKWSGWRKVDSVSKEQIDELYSKGVLYTKSSYAQNEFLVLESGTNSALGQYKGDKIILVSSKDSCHKETGCTPKNKEQQFALHTLTDDDIPLITLTGLPGSGKTFLSFMAGIKLVADGAYERIVYTRPITTVDKGLGFLPGDIEEKWAPYLAPIEDNFRNAFGDLSYFSIMKEKGQIDIAPISYMRGRSFKNCYIIVDEAQNCTPHELKTIITRMAENSKLILCGDTKQIDNVYMDENSNGLSIITGKFKPSDLAAHITFTKGYRSRLATEGDRILE